MPYDPTVDLAGIRRAAYAASARRDEDRLRALGWPIVVHALDGQGLRRASDDRIDTWLEENSTTYKRTGDAVGFTSEDEAFAFRMRFG